MRNNFQDFTYSKKSHFQIFKDFGILGETDINTCNLKVYQDLLVYNFVIQNFPKGSRLLEMGGGHSRVIEALMSDYECWNVDKFEGIGNGPTQTINAQGHNLVVDYIGNFSSELPSNYFDLVFSISVLEHIPEDEKKLKNICDDINRVLKPGGLSLHCIDSLLRKTNLFIPPSVKYIFRYVKTLNEEIKFIEVDRECGYFMSEFAYNRFWEPTIKKNYDEFGMPFSYNVLWEKEVLMLGTDFQNANFLKNQGEFSKAELLYRRAIKQNPSFAWYHYSLGEVLELQGNFEDAINAYQDSIKLSPKSAWFHHKLAQTYSLQGHLEEAISFHRQAIELSPEQSGFYRELGNTLVKQGSLGRATNYYQKALELYPQISGFQHFLGKILPFTEHPNLSDSCDQNLIYDLGMHIGQDTEFYLKKGFNVIAVEANPVLVRDAQNKLSKYIKNQRLIILNVGVASEEGTFPFYVNETLSEWSSFVEKIGARGGKYHTINIKCLPLNKIIAKFGVPYYLKVDIEGHDLQCIESLRLCTIKPKYVSVENGNGGLLECLRELGYDRFKFINQSKINLISCPYPPLEGNFVNQNFAKGASGPFGEETKGRWQNYDEVAIEINNHWSTPNLNANIHGWFDLHAQLSEELQRVDELSEEIKQALVNNSLNKGRKKKEEKIGVFVYGLHKSATMFLYEFFQDLCEQQGIKLFSENNVPNNETELSVGIETSFCVCPIREFKSLRTEKYDRINNIYHIIQVRDPRDILVSEYFSWGWIHKIGSEDHQEKWRKRVQSISIDDYVFSDSDVREPLKPRYKPILESKNSNSPNIIIVRYEEMVTNFRSWVSKTIKPFNFEDEELVTENMYRKYGKEFNVEKESMSHKRKVTPGDHRNKLKPETIQKLNQEYAEILEQFGYQL